MASIDPPKLDNPHSPDQFQQGGLRTSFSLGDELNEDFSDEPLSDAQSISLSTPPRSPRSSFPPGSAKKGRPSSTLFSPTSEDGTPLQEEVGAASSFFKEPDPIPQEGRWAGLAGAAGLGGVTTNILPSQDSGLPTASSITSQSRLLSSDSPQTPSSSTFASVLGPSFQPTNPPSSSAAQQSPKTPLSSRLSQILSSPSSSARDPIATMPVPLPRPTSLPLTYTKGELILGVVVIDFNHLVGPKVEFSVPPSVGEDEQVAGILPFLALPDGAHLSSEDYCYFHLSSAQHSADEGVQTIFGISCNRQIQSSLLLHKSDDVTRSTVQKAVVVLASKPIFGPIRDKLGVVTRAYFNQLDFDQTEILVDFYMSLEGSLSGQLTESALYMGTSLRELVHKFRHKTLVLLKMLMMQKKIMFFGQPVETLCTYQYSLVSLIPGLLDHLTDCASPLQDRRENDFERPSELRTSDRLSLLRYLGLPLNVFGKDAFFQPYLPLQEVDTLKTATSYLVGTTNNIVTQQRDARPDLLVNIETNTFEFSDARTERAVMLTGADRKWMDEIVRSVEGTWVEDDPARPVGMQFLGSDDYLRAKFEDYICSALSGIKYADFLAKGAKGDVLISGAPSPAEVITRFGEAFIGGFRQTRCGKLWDRTTDSVLFDICEPRHPCDNPPSLATDIGLRLTEGLHELNLEERMAPAREALNTAWASSLKAAEGLQAGIAARWAAQPGAAAAGSPDVAPPAVGQQGTPRPGTGLRQLSLVRESFGPALQQGASAASEGAKGVAGVVGGWGTFLAGRVGGAFGPQSPSTPTAPTPSPVQPPAGAAGTPTGGKPPSVRGFSFWERKSEGSVTSTSAGTPGKDPSLLSVSTTSGSASARTSTDTQRESGSQSGTRPLSGELPTGAAGAGAGGAGESKPPNPSRGSSWSWLSRTSSSSQTSSLENGKEKERGLLREEPEEEGEEMGERGVEGLPEEGGRAV